MPRTTQTASHWGVYNVTTDDAGEITGVTPLAGDPSPAGYVSSLPDIVRSELRVDQPYVRAGFLSQRRTRNRGAEPFVPVGWDEALDLVAGELTRVKTEYGNEAIYGGVYGWASAGRLNNAPQLMQRFLALNGGYVDARGNHSFGAALGIMPYVLGRYDVPCLVEPWESIAGSTELMVMFGGAAAKNMQLCFGGAVIHNNDDWFQRAAKAGLKLINISPSRQNLEGREGAEWIPIRPNTDVALMLGLAHTLASQGLADRAFLAKYCVGYDAFERYLLGLDGEPARDAVWAENITGVPAATIVALAQRMAASKTLVTSSWSVQRQDHGEQAPWMTVVLAAMLGQIGQPGRGFSIGFGSTAGSTTAWRKDLPAPSFPGTKNPVQRFIPVAMVAEMLLNPGAEYDYNGAKVIAPDIKLIYSAGGNPFHHNTNLNRIVEAWKRPETIICHESFWNPVSRNADIVLPATTSLERNDILAAIIQRHWVAMHKVIEPVGQARSDYEIFSALAARLGFGEAYTEGRDEMAWLRHMYAGAQTRAQEMGIDAPDFDAFWDKGIFELPQTKPDVLLGAFVADPEANKLRTPSGKIEIYSEKIASFGYEDCPPHPKWLEPAEWLGAAQAKTFPLHMLSNQPVMRLHSQLDPAPKSRARKVKQREPLQMNPADAKARGLADGDVVRVFNARGSFLAGLVVTDTLTPGVVQIATGAWFDPAEPGVPGSLEKHGNPNVVTLDRGSSKLSQSSRAQTALVEVEKAGETPDVTAFVRPAIRESA